MSRRRTRQREAARVAGHLDVLQMMLTPANTRTERVDAEQDVPPSVEETEAKEEKSASSRVDPGDFARRMISELDADDPFAMFWIHLTRDTSHGAINWEPDNPWRPWLSEFELMWWLVFVQRDWTTDQFDDMRIMVIWMIHTGMLRRVTTSMCRTFRAMRAICAFLPGLPPPRNDRALYLLGPVESSQTSSEWSTLREFVESGDDSDAKVPEIDSFNIQRKDSPIYRNHVIWFLQLGLLVPGGWNSIHDSSMDKDVFYDSSETEVTNVTDTPMVRHWKTLTNGSGWTLIRPGRDHGTRLLLKEGCLFRSTEPGIYHFVLSISMLQCKEWVAKRARGDITAADTVNERRPFLRVCWCTFRKTHATWTLLTGLQSACVGLEGDREGPAGCKIEGVSKFKKWVECKERIDWPTVISDRINSGAALINRCAQADQTHQSSIHPALNDAEVLPVFIYLGFDAYAATGFAKSTSSITNFYIKVANKESAFQHFHLYSSLPKDVPYFFILESFWTEMVDLQGQRGVLICEHSEEGRVRWLTRRIWVSVVAVVGDLENIEPMMQCVRSRKDSRTQGCFYRGSEDTLAPDDDFTTLDPRYLKMRDWWRRVNTTVRRCGFSRQTITQLRTAEGLSHHPSSHRWIPSQHLSFNEMIQCLSDAAHDFDRIFECIRVNIISSMGSERQRLISAGLHFLQQWSKDEGSMPLPSDPLALKKTAKSDFRQNYRRSFLFYLAFARVCGNARRVGVLRMALDCYCTAFQCRSGKQVYRFQCKITDLLRELEIRFGKDKENVRIPKCRDLLKLAFVTLPLFRSIVSAQNLDMERTHRVWKLLLARHSNFKGDFLTNAQVRMREKISAEYIWSGGHSGPNMDYAMDPETRARAHPLDPTKPLFEPPSVLGFGSMNYPSLRLDSITQTIIEPTSRDRDRDWWTTLVTFLNELGFVQDLSELRKDCKVYSVQSASIYDFENSADMRLSSKPFLFCGTSENEGREYTPFLQQATEMIKVINVRKCGFREGKCLDLNESKEHVLMATRGPVWILALSADWEEKRRSSNVRLPMDYHFKVGPRRDASERAVRGSFDADMGGDRLGVLWVPGCCVVSTAITAHVCKDSRSRSGCKMREGGWICDKEASPYFGVYHPKWLFSPSLFKPQSARHVYPNHDRQFRINRWL